jgi:hypothetical protein
MRSSCRPASDRLFVPVGQTTLLYKEGPELSSLLWCQHPVASPELVRLGLDGTGRNLPAADEVSA